MNIQKELIKNLKYRMVTLEFNMDVFILSKVMEINEVEKERFIYELLYGIYKIIKSESKNL